VLVIEEEDAVKLLLRRRKEKMLQGLWCFPMLEGHRDAAALKDRLTAMGIRVEELRALGTARHVFTHQVWRMNLWAARVSADSRAPAEHTWVPLREIPDLPMPTAMKAAREALDELNLL